MEGDHALVISKYGLDVKPYNEAEANVTWETCTLRTWLNGEFCNSAFSSEEKERIRQVTVKNPDNAIYGTDCGNDTTDRIFLLSIEEVEQYFADDESRKCWATGYAKKNGAYASEPFGGTSWWHLRSSGSNLNFAAGVNTNGRVEAYGFSVGHNEMVRPAFWLDL